MAEKTPGRLLNPFAFPSETQLRFTLLVWAILSLCWSIGYLFTAVLAVSVGSPVLSELPDLERDVLGVQVDTTGFPMEDILAKETSLAERLADLSESEARDRTHAALAQLSKAAHDQWMAALPYLVLPFTFLLLTCLFIATLYAIRSRQPWSARRPGSPEFRNALDGLVEDAQNLQRELGEGLLAKPDFRVSRGAVGDGQTRGTSRRPRIVLTRAVSLLLKKEIRQHGEPVSIRALILHELAHIANRDVLRSSLAEVSWFVLIPVLILWLALLWLAWSSEGITDPGSHPLVVSLQALGTLLVVEWIRRGLLRSREHFADLRAGLFWRSGTPLRAALHCEGEKISAQPGHLLRLWTGLWKKHPTRDERRKVLDNPSLLFSIRKDAAFLAGFLFGNLLIGSILLASTLLVAADGLVTQIIADLAQKHSEEKDLVYAMRFYYRIGLFGWSLATFVSTYSPPLMAVYFLAGTLGVQTQRESVQQVVESHPHSRPFRSLWMPAFLTALGFEAGLLLAPFRLTIPGSAGVTLGISLWVVYATLLLWLWLVAVRFFAGRILGRYIAARRPSRRLTLGMTLLSALLLFPLTLALLGAQFWIWSGARFSDGGAVVFFGLLGLPSFAFLLVLMLFALAIWQADRQGARKPRCPNCHNDPGGMTVADCCAACDTSLAPWLFIPDQKDSEGATA